MYIKLDKVCKSYENGDEKLVIFDNLDLELQQSTKIAITGESGSGKSTLLNLLGALDSSDSGTIKVGKWMVSDMSENNRPAYRKNELGFIFQFHYLLKDFTARENIMLPLYMHKGNKKKALEKADQLLDSINLWDRRNHLPSQLSGGERQRIAVARSLVNDPNLILADEPSGNLDERNSEIVSRLLFSLVDEYKKTLILVTHDPNLGRQCDRHYHLEKGILSLNEN